MLGLSFLMAGGQSEETAGSPRFASPTPAFPAPAPGRGLALEVCLLRAGPPLPLPLAAAGRGVPAAGTPGQRCWRSGKEDQQAGSTTGSGQGRVNLPGKSDFEFGVFPNLS